MTHASTWNLVSRLYVMAPAPALPPPLRTQRKMSLERLLCVLTSAFAESSVLLYANASVDGNPYSSFFARRRPMRTKRMKKTGYRRSAWTRRVQTQTKMRRTYGRLSPSRYRHRLCLPYGQTLSSCRRNNSGSSKGTRKRMQMRAVTYSSSDCSVSRHLASSRSSKQMQTPTTLVRNPAVRVQSYPVRNESQLLKLDAPQRPLPRLHHLVWDYQ